MTQSRSLSVFLLLQTLPRHQESMGAPIQPRYARVAVDQVSKGYEDLVLDIPGGDGEKTLGEEEKAYTLWRKRYIIIPGASAPPPADIRCGQKLTKQFFDNFLWV